MAKWWWLLPLGGVALLLRASSRTQEHARPPVQRERTRYSVMLTDPPSLEEAGGRATPEGKAAVQEHTRRVVAELEAEGIEVINTYGTLGGFAAALTEGQKRDLEKDPRVSSLSENQRVGLRATTVP
ncbi:protease inhibitor I9 family protein [Kytococcus sedentarius]|uniref:protease inhibitor I9 family protein n=1 Tax=Kytococcus sedentarius TaxID=1276 RepID=UPI0035BC7A8F